MPRLRESRGGETGALLRVRWEDPRRDDHRLPAGRDRARRGVHAVGRSVGHLRVPSPSAVRATTSAHRVGEAPNTPLTVGATRAWSLEARATTNPSLRASRDARSGPHPSVPASRDAVRNRTSTTSSISRCSDGPPFPWLQHLEMLSAPNIHHFQHVEMLVRCPDTRCRASRDARWRRVTFLGRIPASAEPNGSTEPRSAGVPQREQPPAE